MGKPTGKDTDNWPFVPAKYFGVAAPGRAVRVISIHTAESGEGRGSARGIAHWFQVTPKPASAHVCVDPVETIQCVKDNNMAYAAPPLNAVALHIELAGRAAQSSAQWDDADSRAILARAAIVVRQWCDKYGIPIRHLSNRDLLNGKEGIVGHEQVTEVYHKSTHTDPGVNFPWDTFMALVKGAEPR